MFAEATSLSFILVQWNPPRETGGQPISHYKIEYDKLPSFTGSQNSGPFGCVLQFSLSSGAVSDMQSVTVKINNEGLSEKGMYLWGTFLLAFDGQKSDKLPFNTSPDKVRSALEALCNAEEIHVTRSTHCSHDLLIGCMTPKGYSWLITFVSLKNMGDHHYRSTSKLSSRVSHRLSVDGLYLFECSYVRRSTCSIRGRAVAIVGTVQEVQEINVATSPFSVTIGGEASEIIFVGDSLSNVEEKLNSYSKNGMGKILVSYEGCVRDAIGSNDSILLHFPSLRGDLPPVMVSDPAVVVCETIQGKSQLVVGRSSYLVTIPGLTSVHDWYVRVFAYNGIGEGLPEKSNAGTAGMTGDLLLSTGTASIGNSGAFDIGCKYDSFKYASVIGSCGLDVDLVQHHDGDNTIVGNRGVQPFSRQRAGIALGQAFYRDADTILPNNLCDDEFLDISDYDDAWWLASIAVLAFLTFKDVINSNRLFFLHAFT